MPDAALFDGDFLKKLEYLYIVSKKLFRGRLRAERKSTARGTAVEFADYRDYAPGDDLRYIDWNIFRRLDKLLLKLFEEEQEKSVYILVDASASMGFGAPQKLVYAKQVAAALAYVSLANHDRVALAAFDDGLASVNAPCTGKAQIWNVFRFLERAKGGGATAINACCRELAAQVRRRGIAIVVSDFFDPGGFDEGLRQFLYKGFDVYAIHVVDKTEEEPELKGDLALVDSETGDVKEVAVERDTLREYRAEYDRFCHEIEQFCRERGITYLRARTQVLFDDLILKLFRKGGLLK